MPYSEASIQLALQHDRDSIGHRRIVPNISLYSGLAIADLISVTRAGYVNEYEIKISRSDYMADFKKHKHNFYKDTHENPGSSSSMYVPNRFWYVTPPGLLDGLEIPDYAGHLEVALPRTPGQQCVRQVRGAPLLHRDKLTPKQFSSIALGLEIRYWETRKKLAKALEAAHAEAV